MNVINEVQWRILDDESEWLLKNNPHNKVLVQTNIAYRVDYAEYIRNGRLETAEEDVIRFAFFN